MKILIDNGHGVSTPGKRSPDGRFLEYRYCREIAREVVGALRGQGYDAELLVAEDADIRLDERCNRVNSWCDKLGKERVCLVSIHNNAAGNGLAWMGGTGWEAWTSKGQTEGDKLAESLYDSAERILRGAYPGVKIRTDMSDGDRDKEENFTILYRSRCGACLTENFFMDNKEDLAFLESPQGRRAIVALHVEGIKNYVDTKDKGKRGNRGINFG
ncbi:MAG: N-acetylmuramoyl-L-alanine amidase [Muribaculaceae bacterium]|nr:N-acetylmuramoyl-L-alanine amidase [Muribaculaceae bacterium]